jgi:hypothetical protein
MEDTLSKFLTSSTGCFSFKRRHGYIRMLMLQEGLSIRFGIFWVLELSLVDALAVVTMFGW